MFSISCRPMTALPTWSGWCGRCLRFALVAIELMERRGDALARRNRVTRRVARGGRLLKKEGVIRRAD
jgi:hypothetical protein